MAGRQFDRESGEFHDFTPGTFTAAYEAGLAVERITGWLPHRGKDRL